MWASSTDHRLDQNPNNTGKLMVPGVATAGTSAHLVIFAANGIDLADGGAPPSSGFTCPTGTTVVNDAGVGTGPTITVASGASDCSGHVTVLTGTTPTGGTSTGVITLHYGATHSTAWKCSWTPNNVAAGALLGTAQQTTVTPSGETTTVSVMFAGTSALTAATTYAWSWSCLP